jgi:hypothetical protein
MALLSSAKVGLTRAISSRQGCIECCCVVDDAFDVVDEVEVGNSTGGPGFSGVEGAAAIATPKRCLMWPPKAIYRCQLLEFR